MVLVVEDETDIQELLKYHLERDHYRVIATSTGEEGIRCAQGKPDLILLDPHAARHGRSGGLRTLRADAATKKIPIVMLTARTEEADVVTGLEIGRTITSRSRSGRAC